MFWHTEKEVKICFADVRTGNKKMNNSRLYFKLALILNKIIFKLLKLENIIMN